MPRIKYPSEARNNYLNRMKGNLTSFGNQKEQHPTAISNNNRVSYAIKGKLWTRQVKAPKGTGSYYLFKW